MPRLFVDQLTVIDCSYLDPDRGLVGESWIVDLELGGELDAQGMLFDFGLVKKRVKAAIDELVDHKLLVPLHMAGLQLSSDADQVALSQPLSAGGTIELRAPPCAVCLLEAPAIEPAAVERFLAQALVERLPANVARVRVGLRCEPIEGAFYQYSHGLKKHQGQCQRIAHGHCSCLYILREGVRVPALEREWAERWCDIYIGTREDLRGKEQREGREHYRFAYTAAEGAFELLLPAQRCYLLETDSTVEHIAEHLAEQLQRAQPDARFEVRAFEGVGKGALAGG